MTPGPLSRRGPWYSAAPSAVAVPYHVPSSSSRNRFNDGTRNFALRYFSPDPVTALLEAAALHGAYATGFIVGPPPARAWTVFRYQISQALAVVDFGDPIARGVASTTIQELTGDWLGYYHRSTYTLPAHLPAVRSLSPLAPTQHLANSVHASTTAHGFLAPSAKSPTIANLVLFFARLPASVVQHTGSANTVL